MNRTQPSVSEQRERHSSSTSTPWITVNKLSSPKQENSPLSPLAPPRKPSRKMLNTSIKRRASMTQPIARCQHYTGLHLVYFMPLRPIIFLPAIQWFPESTMSNIYLSTACLTATFCSITSYLKCFFCHIILCWFCAQYMVRCSTGWLSCLVDSPSPGRRSKTKSQGMHITPSLLTM